MKDQLTQILKFFNHLYQSFHNHVINFQQLRELGINNIILRPIPDVDSICNKEAIKAENCNKESLINWLAKNFDKQHYIIVF